MCHAPVMIFDRLRSFLIPILTICTILGVSAVVIAYGRGYRLDLRQNSLKPTGLISATSDPIGAQVLVDGKLRTATNNSFNVDPGWYTIRITKEGYLPWEKRIRVQGEVATRIDAFLFPTNPSLSPLTMLGVENPVRSPDGTKLAFTVPGQAEDGGVSRKKAGLWVYELVEGPLGRNRDPQQLDESEDTFNFSQAKIVWSPDSRQLMVASKNTVRLYQPGKPKAFTEISTTVAATLAEWQDDTRSKEQQALAAFPQPIIDMATQSAKIINFSPDETKILYEATAAATLPPVKVPPLIGTNSTQEERNIVKGKFYIYDSREDKNYLLLDKKELIAPSPTPVPRKTASVSPLDQYSANYQLPNLFWFPTSRHLILALPGKIDIMEYDRTNWITVYSGPLVDGFVTPWPTGSRIIILTNLNSGVSTLPNLYTVNLR